MTYGEKSVMFFLLGFITALCVAHVWFGMGCR